MRLVLSKSIILALFLGLSGCFEGFPCINLKTGQSSWSTPVIQSMMPSNISTNSKPTLQVSNAPIGSTLKNLWRKQLYNLFGGRRRQFKHCHFSLQNPLAVGAFQFSVKYVTESGVESECSAPISVFYYDPNISTVTLTKTAQTIAEGNTTFNVDVELSPAKLYDVTVKFNFTGTNLVPNTNYTVSSSEITIPAGSTSAQIPMVLFNDGVKKLDSRININLESINRTQVQLVSALSTTRTYIQDANSTFSTVGYVGFGGNGSARSVCFFRRSD